MGNPWWITASHWVWGPLDPAAQLQRRPLFARMDHTFHHKQKRGRRVGKRELAEKHYSAAVHSVYGNNANPHLDNVLDVTPLRPYPKISSHYSHYHRDWKEQRNWLRGNGVRT